MQVIVKEISAATVLYFWLVGIIYGFEGCTITLFAVGEAGGKAYTDHTDGLAKAAAIEVRRAETDIYPTIPRGERNGLMSPRTRVRMLDPMRYGELPKVPSGEIPPALLCCLACQISIATISAA